MPRYALSRLLSAALIATVFAGLPARADEAESLVPPRPPAEAELIATVTGDAPWEEKQAALRGLREIGTAKSVPALAALLPDLEWSHFARFALETIPDPAVDAALREAIGRTEGPTRAGIVITLGARRDAEAVPLLEPLLMDPDPDTRHAAAAALGRIGTPEAATALFALGERTPPGLRIPVAEGLLAAAERLAAEGNAARAVAICERLFEGPFPRHVRMGALRGLVDADPAGATDLLLGVIAQDDGAFRDLAAQIVAETGDDTGRFADALAELPEPGQIALLRGLATRGDAAARDAVLALAAEGGAEARAAAVRALGRLGAAGDAPMLIALLDNADTGLAGAARDALRAIDDSAVDAQLAAAIPGASAARKVALLELLGVRVAPETLPAAVAATEDPDATVRAAGLRILTDLGAADELDAAVAALTRAATGEERSLSARAVGAIAAREGEAVLGPLLVAMGKAGGDTRLALLRAVAQVRGGKALEAVLAVVRKGDAPEMRDEAVRILSTWPTSDAAPHLLALAKESGSPHRDAGLRGYVRLARGEGDPAAKAAMLSTAMELTTRTEERWSVLAAWGTLHAPEALAALTPHLAAPETRNEAASAILTVANALARHEAHRPAARDAVDAVIAAVDDEAVLDRARTARANLE